MILKFLKTISVLLVLFAIVVASIVFIINFYPVKYEVEIKKLSEKYGLDRSFVYAVIKTESNFNPNAVSHKGAKGLMQIMDKTGEWAFEELGADSEFDPRVLFEPNINIEIGCWYLDKLHKQYKDINTALAAYNAGSGNVSKWINNGDYHDGKSLHTIPFKETRNYVRKVNKNKKIYEVLRGIKS